MTDRHYVEIDLPGELADRCMECGGEPTDDCPVCEHCRHQLDRIAREAVALSIAQNLEVLA